MLTFPGPLLEARFVARPNRFVIEAVGPTGPLRVRCPSPGRMKELLTPDARLLVHPRTGGRTDADLVLIHHARRWISIDTQLPNRLFADHLAHGRIPAVRGVTAIRREIPIGASRIDFLIERGRRKPLLVEVKSVDLVISRVAHFPDAPSLRASRHLEELIAARKEGYEPWVVFMIQRPDCDGFRPHAETDPLFTETLDKAVRNGVRALAFTHQVTRRGIQIDREVPVLLSGPRGRPRS